MLTCKEITEQASDYCDKELSSFKRMSFKLHLLMCHHCRRYMKQVALVIETVAKLGKKTTINKQESEKLARQLLKERQADLQSNFNKDGN